MYTVNIFIRVVSGIGSCFLYLPTWISVNTYYKEKRQLANGLVLSGSVVGVIAFPPFVELLLKEFGLQGVFLILGGVSLNTVIIGALIPPLDTSESKTLVDNAPPSGKELKDEEK